MAATAVALQQLRTNKHRAIRNPNFVHFFSSSNSDPNFQDQTPTTPTTPSSSQSPFSSYFSDVKASLKQQSPQPTRPPPPRKPFSPSSTEKPPSKVASLEEIRKNLSEFRRRSAPPLPDANNSPPPPPSLQNISFQELYKKNVASKAAESTNEAPKGGNLSYEAIRESLRQLRSTPGKNLSQGPRKDDGMSLSKFTNSLKLRPLDPNVRESPVFIGETGKLPESVFGKEIKGRNAPESATMKTEFVKMYSFGELGEKLRKLRPEVKGANWFSLEELNERLMKLREVEEKQSESRIGGVTYKDLRESLVKLQMSNDEQAKKSSMQKLSVLSQFGVTPEFMLVPPKEKLVEKYFHPDNMSSSEKMKLELKKVRDEFKMSESDCGSARVQVAQLTTKIKHLSTALHKKDKHSRKGLVQMVQRRKRLLKYLRRTDWDSYCLVLSKLGLRDNPDYKN